MEVKTLTREKNSKSVEDLLAELRQKSAVIKLESLDKRKARLKKLLDWVMENRDRVKRAVHEDFQKPAVEADISEAYPVIGEIKHAIANLDQWARPTKVDATINYLGTWSEVRYEPKGVCLILSPWNFPFNLSVCPLVSCLAAGNVAMLKPSELTPNTATLIDEMVNEVFDGEVAVIQGDKEMAASLLRLRFDHIFFTGSSAVGKLVMKAAADHLASVTLELGGKSPTVVDKSARIKEAAKRIAFGKFLNNGQTCIAPDYILVHHAVKQKLINELIIQIKTLFGDGRILNQQSNAYGRVINQNHFSRLQSLMNDAIERGATLDMTGEMNGESKFFHPTILSNVAQDSRIMSEEIFGPILPVVTYEDLNEVIELINGKPKPLALYIFGTDRKFREAVLSQTSAGSVCINDCVLQFTHPNLPFGGVNNSGIGKSHGRYGFLAFSNEKPVLRQKRGFALSYLFHPPYSKKMKMLLEPILRWF